MDSLLQAPLFVFLRRAALDRLPTLTALFAGVVVFFWMVRPPLGCRRSCYSVSDVFSFHSVSDVVFLPSFPARTQRRASGATTVSAQ
jgi:hypothetical protein